MNKEPNHKDKSSTSSSIFSNNNNTDKGFNTERKSLTISMGDRTSDIDIKAMKNAASPAGIPMTSAGSFESYQPHHHPSSHSNFSHEAATKSTGVGNSQQERSRSSGNPNNPGSSETSVNNVNESNIKDLNITNSEGKRESKNIPYQGQHEKYRPSSATMDSVSSSSPHHEPRGFPLAHSPPAAGHPESYHGSRSPPNTSSNSSYGSSSTRLPQMSTRPPGYPYHGYPQHGYQGQYGEDYYNQRQSSSMYHSQRQNYHHYHPNYRYHPYYHSGVYNSQSRSVQNPIYSNLNLPYYSSSMNPSHTHPSVKYNIDPHYKEQVPVLPGTQFEKTEGRGRSNVHSRKALDKRVTHSLTNPSLKSSKNFNAPVTTLHLQKSSPVLYNPYGHQDSPSSSIHSYQLGKRSTSPIDEKEELEKKSEKRVEPSSVPSKKEKTEKEGKSSSKSAFHKTVSKKSEKKSSRGRKPKSSQSHSQGGSGGSNEQKECCIIGCSKPVTNRLRYSLRCHTESDFKPSFLEKGWNKICHYHYFSDLYHYKKMTLGKPTKLPKREHKSHSSKVKRLAMKQKQARRESESENENQLDSPSSHGSYPNTPVNSPTTSRTSSPIAEKELPLKKQKSRFISSPLVSTSSRTSKPEILPLGKRLRETAQRKAFKEDSSMRDDSDIEEEDVEEEEMESDEKDEDYKESDDTNSELMEKNDESNGKEPISAVKKEDADVFYNFLEKTKNRERNN